MTALLLFTLVAGLVIYGLQRNHVRQSRHPALAGSVNFTDRDADRVRAEVAAAVARRRPNGHRRPAGCPTLTTRAA
ncbi:MAG: hypothetical protein GEU94_04885 [Micromonosporaceae bacterium]|nr:hypothetical protein [Micromonosporaceae bacterium]